MIEKASLSHLLRSSDIPLEAAGVLLEWQVTGLGENLWNSEKRSVVSFLLRDALHVYGGQFPIRRARYVCAHSVILI